MKSARKLTKPSASITIIALLAGAILMLSAVVYSMRNDLEKVQRDNTLQISSNQLRNKYAPLSYNSQDQTFRIPGSLLEIKAKEDVLYSYQAGYEGVQPDIISLTLRQVFDNSMKVAQKPECATIAKIESEERAALDYEDPPTEISLSRDNSSDERSKYYVYTPKLKVCNAIYSDEDLLRVQGYAISLKYTY